MQFGLPETNVLLIADEGEPDIVDAVLAISERICQQSGEELDGESIFERWLDTRYLTGKSAEGFKKSPGLVADTLEMVGRWRDLSAVYDDVVAAINAVPGTLAGQRISPMPTSTAHVFTSHCVAMCPSSSVRPGIVRPGTRQMRC